jgi:hypothetical protein
MKDEAEYLDKCAPATPNELDDAATDTLSVIAGQLAGLEHQLRVFEHHNRDAASLEISRRHAADVHSFVCARLRDFGRRRV